MYKSYFTKYGDRIVAFITKVSLLVPKSLAGEFILICPGANTERALYMFNLPAPLFKSQPGSPMSSQVDFIICLTSSLVKFFRDKIKAAVAETKGADAEVPFSTI